MASVVNSSFEVAQTHIDYLKDDIKNLDGKVDDLAKCNKDIHNLLLNLPSKENFKDLQAGITNLEKRQEVNDQKILLVQKLSFLFVSMIITITIGLVLLFFRTKIFT